MEDLREGRFEEELEDLEGEKNTYYKNTVMGSITGKLFGR